MVSDASAEPGPGAACPATPRARCLTVRARSRCAQLYKTAAMLAFASTAEAFSAAPLRSAPSARASLSMLDGKTTLDSDGGPLGPVTTFAAPSVTAYPEAGATAPLGVWDPFGLSKSMPAKAERWAAVEIKHGRIAMVATLGYIAQECFRWPGYLSTSAGVKFADLPNGIAGLKGVPPLGLAQILLFIGLMEIVTWPYYEGKWPGSVPSGKAPGDVAGDFWVRYSDPAEKAYKLNVERNNGRAAMLGITGMLMHDHITGSWIPPGL